MTKTIVAAFAALMILPSIAMADRKWEFVESDNGQEFGIYLPAAPVDNFYGRTSFRITYVCKWVQRGQPCVPPDLVEFWVDCSDKTVMENGVTNWQRTPPLSVGRRLADLACQTMTTKSR